MNSEKIPNFQVYPVRVNELAEILQISPPVVSRRLSSRDVFTVRNSSRAVGVTPEGVEDYFRSQGHEQIYKTSVIVVSSVCGGTQKTSSTVSLASAARRITSRKKAVVVLDLDSQASATEVLLGKPVADGDPVLVDYLEGKSSLDQILKRVGNPEENFWVVGSNLNNIFLEKNITSPSQIKSTFQKIYRSLISKFGEGTRIFADTAPALSSTVSSTLTGLALIQSDHVTTCHLLPNRGDGFSTTGNVHSIRERDEILDAFGLPRIPTTIFLSAFDARLSSSIAAFKKIVENEVIGSFLSPVIVRNTSAVTKSSMACTSIFSRKPNTAAEDYTALLLFLLGFQGRKGRA